MMCKGEEEEACRWKFTRRNWKTVDGKIMNG